MTDDADILKMNSCDMEDFSRAGEEKVDSVQVSAKCLGDSECVVGGAKKQEVLELDEMLWCKRLLDEILSHEDSQAFALPADAKLFPNYWKVKATNHFCYFIMGSQKMLTSSNAGSNFYHQVVEIPMDLTKIQKQLAASNYKCRKDFLDDGEQRFLWQVFDIHVLSNV